MNHNAKVVFVSKFHYVAKRCCIADVHTLGIKKELNANRLIAVFREDLFRVIKICFVVFYSAGYENNIL